MMGHHAKVDHDSIDEMMTSIAQASESLKWITHMPPKEKAPPQRG